MTRQLINIGTTANDGAGDPLRIAFNKINNNFTELYSGLPALSIGPIAPVNPAPGQQWWDSQDGNSYIFYQPNPPTAGNWVPSTSTVSLQSQNVRNAVGTTININFASDGVITTTLTTNLSISFVNYTSGVTVRLIISTASTSYSITHGVPAAQASSGSTSVAISVAPSTMIIDYTCTGTSISSVFVKI
jgi:hypothetical protein